MSSPIKSISFAHSSAYKWYGVSTDEIKELNDLAVRAEYNRALTDEAIALLTPDVIHPIQCVMPSHTNFAGKFSIRAMLSIKMTNSDKLQTAFIDISHRKWNSLMSKRKHYEK